MVKIVSVENVFVVWQEMRKRGVKMQEYLRKLKKLKAEYVEGKNERANAGDGQLSVTNQASMEKYDACIKAIDECIEIFTEADQRVVSDINFLISLCDGWKKDVPKGNTPMGYVTLSYEGDMEIKKRFDLIMDTYVKLLVPESEEKPKKRGLKNWGDKLGAIE
jgi:hypothetical protein